MTRNGPSSPAIWCCLATGIPGCFETLVADVRALLRLAAGCGIQPTAVILDSRTLQSTPDSGAPQRASFDGHKRQPRKGSKVYTAVDTLGHLRALYATVTSSNEQDRAQVATLAAQMQAVTSDHVELAEGQGPKRGFILLPRRWVVVVECGFAWAARFRRLARDYERLPIMLARLHFVAFACLMLTQLLHRKLNP